MPRLKIIVEAIQLKRLQAQNPELMRLDTAMKRKLNEVDAPIVPATVRNAAAADLEEVEACVAASTFNSLGLEPRLLQAVATEGFTSPTPIQTKAIPVALEGKDILARSKTGSGKTAAYVLPILQSLLQRKNVSVMQTLRVSITANTCTG